MASKRKSKVRTFVNIENLPKFMEIMDEVKEDNDGIPNITIAAKKFCLTYGYPYEDNVRRKFSKLLEKTDYFNQDTVVEVTEENFNPAKVLFFDIETSLMESLVFSPWNNYKIPLNRIVKDWDLLCFSAKWMGTDKMIQFKLTEEELKNSDDRRVVKEIWKLMDEADIVVAHNCVEVNTPVLKSDLTWVRAGDLKEGDELIGFEEKVAPGTPVRDSEGNWVGARGRKRRDLRLTKVTGNVIEKQPCMKVTFDNGDEVITTPDHYWLSKSFKDNNQRWRKTSDLEVGHRVSKLTEVWKKNDSYEAGWLSGFLEGEGSLVKAGRQGSDGCTVLSGIQACQRPTTVLDRAIEYSNLLGYSVTTPRTKSSPGLGLGDTKYFIYLGGKWEMLRIIGELDITRFKGKITNEILGGMSGRSDGNIGDKVIVKIEEVGEMEVAVMGTTEKTFIANGYPMHNCDRFDLPKSNAKFLEHGLGLPSPFQTLDTFKLAKRNLAPTSLSLDYLAKFVGLKGKIESTGLWDRIAAGDYQALEEMAEYCNQDVEVLIKVFLELRPYLKGLPNMGLFAKGTVPVCSSCGSDDLMYDKNYTPYRTTVNEFESMKCACCGSWSRARVATKNPNKVQTTPMFR